jgi:nucleoside-diphosphate-sugar epimerase
MQGSEERYVQAMRVGHGKGRAPEITAWGTGSVTREFLYVEDAAAGIAEGAEKYAKPEPMNLGSGGEISIRELLEMIRSLVGYEGTVRWDATKPDGQPLPCLDTSRALAEFGWRAKMPLQEGLRKTIPWYAEEVGSKSRTQVVGEFAYDEPALFRARR